MVFCQVSLYRSRMQFIAHAQRRHGPLMMTIAQTFTLKHDISRVQKPGHLYQTPVHTEWITVEWTATMTSSELFPQDTHGDRAINWRRRHALVLQCNPYSRTSGYNTLQWRTAWNGTLIDWVNNNDRRLTIKSLNDVASILQTNRRAVNSVFEHHLSCQTNDAIMLARCSLLHIRARTLETHHQTISSL